VSRPRNPAYPEAFSEVAVEFFLKSTLDKKGSVFSDFKNSHFEKI